MSKIITEINGLNRAQEIIDVKRMKLIEKGLKSDNPNEIISANKLYNKTIAPKFEDNTKSFVIDPLEFNSSLGFKDKMFSLSYTTLARMSKTPIISSIIKTRKNQVADFAEPQNDKYSNGFLIRKKGNTEGNLSNMEKKTVNYITDFLLNCGASGGWDTDDFDTFIRKVTDDSLTYDQMTFECIRNNKGQLERFIATDAATFRIADTRFSDEYQSAFQAKRSNQFFDTHLNLPDYKGYKPSFAQVYQNSIVNEFYPWELCFGVRNPTTNVHSNGYGISELEELINVVTSMLWGDEYNRRFFSQGSAPKGLLRIKGNTNEKAIQQFKQQWQAMISGVMQSWKTPVVEADVDWIDLQKTNRDMEYTAWMEYLIKIACAIYSIDPTEIGWDISKSGGGSMFGENKEETITHSKDKGLYPLLKFLQRKLNKYVVEQIDPEYELVFVGINGMTLEKELDLDIKKTKSFQTINETRKKYNMKPIENGDIIEDSVFAQQLAAARQQEAQQQMQAGAAGAGDGNPFEEKEYNPFEAYNLDENGEPKESSTEKLKKAFDNFLNEEENED